MVWCHTVVRSPGKSEMRAYQYAACLGLTILILGVTAWFVTPGSAVQIIRVQESDAEETARLLDETFNGSGPARIVVFKIPATQLLFIKADSLDLLTIRMLLRPLVNESE